MIIKQNKNDDIQLSMSLLEYKRLFIAVEDYVIEYCSDDDMLVKMWEQMKEFNG